MQIKATRNLAGPHMQCAVQQGRDKADQRWEPHRIRLPVRQATGLHGGSDEVQHGGGEGEGEKHSQSFAQAQVFLTW